MRFATVTILGLWVSVFGLISSCQAASLEYSNTLPWTLVYEVYPYSSSEAVVEVWKNDKPSQISGNLAASLSQSDQSRTILYTEAIVGRNGNDTADSNVWSGTDGVPERSSSNQGPQITQWPLNLRNWPKNSKTQDNSKP